LRVTGYVLLYLQVFYEKIRSDGRLFETPLPFALVAQVTPIPHLTDLHSPMWGTPQ
jgi:hypothetical protein